MLIANCSKCGAIFRSRAIAINGGVQIAISNVKETCPHCGSIAQVVDGIFSITNGMLEIISAPDFTRQIYQHFLELAQQAQDKKIDENDFIDAATAIDPRLGTIATLVMKNKRLGLLILLIYFLSNLISIDVKLDVNELFDQVFNSPGVQYILPDNEL